jgi:hypothetical protein
VSERVRERVSEWVSFMSGKAKVPKAPSLVHLGTCLREKRVQETLKCALELHVKYKYNACINSKVIL